MSHTGKLLLAVPLGLLLAAGTASAQPRPVGSVPGGYMPGYYPGPYLGAVPPVGSPTAYFGNVRPVGYPSGVSPLSYAGLSYPYGGFGYPNYGGSGVSIGIGIGIGGRYPNYGSYGYGLSPPPGYGLGYPIRVGGYGVRAFGYDPAYSAVLGTPAALGAAPAQDLPPPRPVGGGNAQPAAAGVAVVTVLVPDGADLWFNGEEQDEKTSCQYVSDPIPAGQTKTLEIKVKWDGSTSTMKLPLRAGDKMTVDLRKVK